MSKNRTLQTSGPFSTAAQTRSAEIISFPAIDRLPSLDLLKQVERVELCIALDGRPHGASSTLYSKEGMPVVTDCNPIQLLEALQKQHENPDSIVVKIKSGNGLELFEGTPKACIETYSAYAEEQSYKPIIQEYAPATCEQS
ncbi:MAG: hypothetical protein KDJ75_09660 [Alphaproteobacteria bacterium]|nr:hypothetical protein [Alphaproteobacteria bacterium]